MMNLRRVSLARIFAFAIAFSFCVVVLNANTSKKNVVIEKSETLDPIIGFWETFDDKIQGQHKSTVKIWKEKGLYHGRIVELYNLPAIGSKNDVPSKVRWDKDGDPICFKCSSKNVLRYNKKIKGMIVFENMAYDPTKRMLSGNTILDPQRGKTYTAKLWLDSEDKKDTTLYVRGYLGWFFRTQLWYRTNSQRALKKGAQLFQY